MSRFIDRAELFNRLSAVKTLAEAYAVVQDMPAVEIKNVFDTNVGDMISRQAAIDALKEHRALYCDNTPDTFSKLSYAEKGRVDELDTAIATLVNLPSAERHGRWEDRGSLSCRCSECGCKANKETAYCPNCGASMMDDNAIQHTERAENALGALDEVEVKRCVGCKHYDRRTEVCHNPRFGDGWANYPPPSVNEDFFCADGAKTDEVTR